MTALALAVGMVIAERYELLAELGRGGMGCVFLAEHGALGKRVALKVLHPDFAANSEFRARFLREAKVSSRLHHPTAVGVHDFGEHEGSLYLVMDLLRGRSLFEALHSGPLSLEETRQHVRALADVLDVAHAIPLIHRDLKPENVMLVPLPGGGERPIVVDFGLAFVQSSSDDLGRSTRDGMVAGTPAYMSPEQIRGLSIGPPSDIYALGCVLYEMLTGRPPFEGEPAALLGMHLYVEAPRPSSVGSRVQIPPDIEELCVSMLHKDAARRPVAAVVRDVLDGAPRPQVARASNPGQGPREVAQASTEPTGAFVPDVAPVADVFAAVWRTGVTPEIMLACALGGIALLTVTAVDQLAAHRIVLATEPSDDELDALIAAGKLVVVGVRDGELARIVSALRAGAADAVKLPLEPNEVVTKLRRTARARAPTRSR